MNLEMIWHSNYWDGPLSGAALYNGEPVWFNCVLDDDTDVRTFTLYEFVEEERVEIYRRHKLFQEMVGYHTDHHPDVYADFEGMGAKKDFKKFYDMDFPNIDPTKGKKIREVAEKDFKYLCRPR